MIARSTQLGGDWDWLGNLISAVPTVVNTYLQYEMAQDLLDVKQNQITAKPPTTLYGAPVKTASPLSITGLGSDNTMTYVLIGGAALLGVLLITRMRK